MPRDPRAPGVKAPGVDTAVLRRLLRYDPATGVLRWNRRTPSDFSARPEWECRRWNTRYADRRAGSLCPAHGYINISIQGLTYRAHRVCWAIYYGVWPRFEIDHENGVRTDNRIFNLRDATRQRNMQNMKLNGRNTSGCPGVKWSVAEGKWKVQIGTKPRLNLGTFVSLDAAIAARKAAEHKQGYHPSHGRKT